MRLLITAFGARTNCNSTWKEDCHEASNGGGCSKLRYLVMASSRTLRVHVPKAYNSGLKVGYFGAKAYTIWVRGTKNEQERSDLQAVGH